MYIYWILTFICQIDLYTRSPAIYLRDI